jgi:glyoxylase-like metal-dependent hydrolase (beta-lactamase superfamily II)
MQITDTVTLLESAKGSYVYLTGGKERAMVDTGLPFRRAAIVRELQSMDIPMNSIKHIVLTHYDVDHIGNAARLQRLTGAVVWASAVEIPYILGQKPRPGFKKYIAKLMRVEIPHDIRPLSERISGADIAVIPTPGHTPGHVCLLHRGVLFAGDLVENHRETLVPYPSGWNWDTTLLKKSIQEVSKYRFEWVCPAHGRPLRREEWWNALTGA